MFVVDAFLHAPYFLLSTLAMRKVVHHKKLPKIAKIIVILSIFAPFCSSIFYCAASYQFKPNNNGSPADFNGIVANGLPTTPFGVSIVFHEMFLLLHLCLAILVAIERYINKNYRNARKTYVVLIYLVLIFIISYLGTLGLQNGGLEKSMGKMITTVVMLILHIIAPYALNLTLAECVRSYRADIGQPLDERCFCNSMKYYNKRLLKSLIGEAVIHLLVFLFRFAGIFWFGGISFDYSYTAYHYLMVLGSTVFPCWILGYSGRNILHIIDKKPIPRSPILAMKDRSDQHFAVLNQMWQ